jgi:hypothetical protein
MDGAITDMTLPSPRDLGRRRNSPLGRAQPVDNQCDDQIGGFGCGGAVIGGQSPVRHVTDQRGQYVGHQPRRRGATATWVRRPYSSTAISSRNKSSFDSKYG